MTFDPVAYWKGRGPTYESNFRRNVMFEEQERRLMSLLDPLAPFSSVLEVGCGFGRITQLIRPLAKEYTALDVSGDQIEAAKRHVDDVEWVVSSFEDFEPDRAYDLVIASEVLMHIPPSRIVGVVDKMKSLSGRHVVSIDLAFPSGPTPAVHNWLHDYAEMYSKGVSIYKIDGTAQAIFHLQVR